MSKIRVVISIIFGLIMCSGFVTAIQNPRQPIEQLPQNQEEEQQQTKKKSYVDYEAELIEKVETDTIIRLIGDVVFHHNGVIIQCDSSYRYNDSQMDCFGNVIINQDSTYIYGDKVVYDGNINMAKVYSPLIKITNGTETVMYTYNLSFNTQTKVGEFSGGGVVNQRDNMMESERGFYYVDLNEVKLMDSVCLKNKDYKVKTDSLRFNLDTEVTTFLTRTYIWDSEDDFITAKSGTYEHRTRTYTFTNNAYIMTPDQESWADSIIYQSLTKEAFMKRNIQILDTTQNTLAFGDWGYHNDSLKKSILALKASIRSWEKKKEEDGTEKADTAYMRADSIWIETFPLGTTKPKDTITTQDSQSVVKTGSTSDIMNTLLGKSASGKNQVTIKDTTAKQDSLSVLNKSDSLGNNVLPKLNTLQVADSVVNKTLPRLDTLQVADSAVNKTLPRLDTLQVADSAARQRRPMMDSVAVKMKKEKGDTVERLIRAFRKVEMYRKDFQGRCDSLVGYSVDSTISMFGTPVLWNEDNQITAEQIDIYTDDEKMDWADFIGNPIIAQKLDSTHYNQATGKEMQAYFKDNEIYRSILSGNVVNYYYSDEDKELVSFDKIESAELEIYYEKREPVTMKWFGQSDWVMYPIEKIPTDQPQLLEGFKWITEGRAKTSRDICARIVRESLRADYEKLPKPVFTIQDKISHYKELLLKEGTWHDRTDMPSYTYDYFKNVDERLK